MYNMHKMHNTFTFSVVEKAFKTTLISPENVSRITKKYFMQSEYIYILVMQSALGISVRRSYKVSNYNGAPHSQ